MAETAPHSEIPVSQPNLLGRIDAVLFGMALNEQNEDTFLRLRRAGKGLIESSQRLNSDFQEQNIATQFESVDSTFDLMYPEEMESVAVRMSVSLPTSTTETLLKNIGALVSDDNLALMRKDASDIGPHGFWVKEKLPTNGLDGAQISICGLTGGQYGYFDIAVIMPRQTLRSVVLNPAGPSKFDIMKFYKKPPMNMSERFGIIYAEQAGRFAAAQAAQNQS